MEEVVDLCTPPSSPRQVGSPGSAIDATRIDVDFTTSSGSQGESAAEHFTAAQPSTLASSAVPGPPGICELAATDTRAPRVDLPIASAAPSHNALGKRPASSNPGDTSGKRSVCSRALSTDDDECMEVERPREAPAPLPSAGQLDQEDEEVVCTGRTGCIALSDFPHARENCVASPWTPGTEAHACPNCFCYVCDDVATSCPQWSEHCKATHMSAKWRSARKQWKTHAPTPAPSVAGGSSASVVPTPASSVAGGISASAVGGWPPPRPTGMNRVPGESRWSAQQLLEHIEQVYPVERDTPAGFADGYSMRPHQRQSLAFMLDVETAPPGGGAGSDDQASTRVRGGWLADEMGMGKTVVCAALILETRREGQTVVLVNNSLVGQWYDELRKCAPGLHVCKKYGSGSGDHRNADVIVTTPHSALPGKPTGGFICHRLIVDESHLYEQGALPKMPATKFLPHIPGHSSAYDAKCVWMVTGTPFSHSLEQLKVQAKALGHWSAGLKIGDMHDQFIFSPERSEQIHGNQWFADQLKKVMIRHTKRQRIHGEAALSLPDADVETVWLTMSADERALYALSSCADGVPTWADVNRVNDASLADLNKGLTKRRAALATDYIHDVGSMGGDAMARLARGRSADSVRWAQLTKLRALKDDLWLLRAANPGVSVVIFTHHNDVMTDVAKMLREEDMIVFEVSRRTEPSRRHTALRQFQNVCGGGRARAFCTTFSAAAVGLTLTAASRVYLLEASLDPAQEAQAAGRIHRLGQTKEVLVKRFYFRESLDEAVDELHQKLKSGALALESGRFPRAALQILRDHGVAEPHKRDTNAPMTDAHRRYRSNDGRNVAWFGGDGGFDYGKTVKTQPCPQCGAAVEVPGTSVWWGKGNLSSLNGKTDDYPLGLRNPTVVSHEAPSAVATTAGVGNGGGAGSSSQAQGSDVTVANLVPHLAKVGVKDLKHAFHCSASGCQLATCISTQPILNRMRAHVARCSNSRASGAQPVECKVCKLWEALHRTRNPGQMQ